MSEYFKTPEERGIVIGLAVTFVFPMSAWMSRKFPGALSLFGTARQTLTCQPNSRFLPGKVRSTLPHRLQGSSRLCSRVHAVHIGFQMVVFARAGCADYYRSYLPSRGLRWARQSGQSGKDGRCRKRGHAYRTHTPSVKQLLQGDQGTLKIENIESATALSSYHLV